MHKIVTKLTYFQKCTMWRHPKVKCGSLKGIRS